MVDAFTVRVATLITDPSLAEMLALCWLVTPSVVISKVVEVAPAGTDTETGTEASLLLLVSSIVIPLSGASEVRVRVPVTAAPPITLAGDSVNVCSAGATTFKLDVLDAPFNVAVITTGVSVNTAMVLMANVACELFWEMVTVSGTIAAVCPLES